MTDDLVRAHSPSAPMRFVPLRRQPKGPRAKRIDRQVDLSCNPPDFIIMIEVA